MIGCRGRWPIDVVFSVSENAGVGETREAFGLLRKMVETIEMGPMQAQVGLAPRSCRSSTDEIKLMEHDSETGFNSHLEVNDDLCLTLLFTLMYSLYYLYFKRFLFILN